METSAPALPTSESWLIPAAMRSAASRGRKVPEPPHPYRTMYMRDRDRVLHSAAFRRLLGKTQVFIGQPSDHVRTRLTHTLEVCQIARTAARALRLNEDLTEVVALVHDVGHPPFGHAGERALNARMVDFGGFEHNRQGLWLVDRLEQRYPHFDGLNLSYEVLESIALHSSERDHPDIAGYAPHLRMLAESQLVDLADSIAYTAHDIDDALRRELITFADLRQNELWRLAEDNVRDCYGHHSKAVNELMGKQLARATLRHLTGLQVDSLLRESSRRLNTCQNVHEVKHATENVVCLDPTIVAYKAELGNFLFHNVYRHEQVVSTTRAAEAQLLELFDTLLRQPERLHERFRRRLDEEPPERVVCDFIAGMTDRFAQRLHAELCGS